MSEVQYPWGGDDSCTVGIAPNSLTAGINNFSLRTDGYHSPGIAIGSPSYKVDKTWVDSLMHNIKSRDIQVGFAESPIRCEFAIMDDGSYNSNACTWSIAIKPDNGILYTRGIQYKALIPAAHKNNNRLSSLQDDPFSLLTYKNFDYGSLHQIISDAKQKMRQIMDDFLSHVEFIDFLTESGCGILCESNRREITLEEVFRSPNDNYGFVLNTIKGGSKINNVLNALTEKNLESINGGYKMITIKKEDAAEQHIFEIIDMETFRGFCELFKAEG